MELEHARIAGRIKESRKEAGLTQQQMAELLGVIQRTYQNYEAETNPRIPWDLMNDIARVTGKKVEWLLHGDTPDLVATMNGNGDEALTLLRDIDRKLDEVLRRLPPAEEGPGTADEDAGPVGPLPGLDEGADEAPEQRRPSRAQSRTRRQGR